MKISLLKNKPEGVTKEEFVKNWENLGWSLSALYLTLKEMSDATEVVKPDDFNCPNHYALLAYQAGRKACMKEIMDMLPESSKIK